METDDRAEIERMKLEFEHLSQLAENEFEGCLSFEKRMNYYKAVYDYALKPFSMTLNDPKPFQRLEELYIDFQEMLTRLTLRFQVDPRWTKMDLFRQIVRRWSHYKLLSKLNCRNFRHLEHFIQISQKMPLQKVAMSIFLEQVQKPHEVMIRDVTLDLIERERDGDAVDHNVIQLATEMLSSTAIEGFRSNYDDLFFQPFLRRTAQFYQKESSLWAVSDNANIYAQRAETRINNERSRCKRYFSSREEREVMDVVQNVLLLSECAKVVLFHPVSGFDALLGARDYDALRRFHRLYSHLPQGSDRMSGALRERLRIEGSEKSKRHSGADKDINCSGCVADLVELQEDFLHIVATCFASSPAMTKALKEGLERVFNQGIQATDSSGTSVTISFSEILAQYSDTVVRRGDEAEMEKSLDQVVGILTHISDRDAFQSHARELLAKRLLTPFSKVSEVGERLLLTKLKQRCGAQFTAPFEGMINDKTSSNELSQRFKDYMGSAEGEFTLIPYEFNCMVLKTGIWPKLPVESLSIPFGCAVVLQKFESFYKSIADRRVLKWCHSHGGVLLQCNFSKGLRELQINMLQACVLLLFSEKDQLAVQDIANQLNVKVEELPAVLSAYAKNRILIRRTDSAQAPLSPTDDFAVNLDFTSAHRKIQIPLSNPRVSVANSIRLAQQVDDDRRPAIDACIVRVMKSRRELSHANLLAECQQQLSARFVPDPKMIKLRVEDLIKREYLERLPENSSVYRYLA